MTEVLLILGYRRRIFRRWLSEHAFALFVLGPIPVGGALLIGERYLDALRRPLTEWLTVAPDQVGAILALVISVALWPGTVSELFGRGHQGDDLLDALPVTERARFAASLVICLARTAWPVLLLLGSTAVLKRAFDTPAWWSWLGRGLVAIALLAVTDILLALLLVRWRWLSAARLGGLAAGFTIALLGPWPWLRGLIWPWALAGKELAAIWSQALNLPAPPAAWVPLALTTLGMSLAAAAANARWRRRHLETARQLLRPRARLISRWVLSWLRGGAIQSTSQSAQLRRDLLLILRRFSPAVPLTVIGAAAIDLLLVGIAVGQQLPELWIRRILVLGVTVSVLAIVSLVPFLLRHQLPRLWLEKAVGVDLESIWQTKVKLALVLAIPPLLVGLALLAWTTPGGPDAVIEAMWQACICTLVVSSVLGLASFEIADQPWIGLIISLLVGLALACLFIFYPQAWWLWLAFFGYLAGQIAGRATRRVRFTEIES